MTEREWISLGAIAFVWFAVVGPVALRCARVIEAWWRQ